MFTLRKLKIDEDKYSALEAGYTTKGSSLSIFKHDVKDSMQSATLEDVKEGWQIMLENRDEWHNTSKIREVVSREPHKVVFKTQTSLYELVRTVEGN